MSLRELIALGSLPLIAALESGGWQGGLGYVLGAGGSLLNLWAWWLLLGTLGNAVAQTRDSKGATTVVILSFLLKAPLMFALVYGAQRLGGVASLWCIGGIVLVYSLTVLWALGRS